MAKRGRKKAPGTRVVPQVAASEAERCRGIRVSGLPARPPIYRCKAPRVPGSDYCAVCAGRADQQAQLRAALRPDWEARIEAAEAPGPAAPVAVLPAHVASSTNDGLWWKTNPGARLPRLADLLRVRVRGA